MTASLVSNYSDQVKSLSEDLVEDDSGDRLVGRRAIMGRYGYRYPSEQGKSVSASSGVILRKRRQSILRGG